VNQEQLNAIKERVAKVTLGPWDIDQNSDDDVFVTDIWFNGADEGHAEIHGNDVASSIYNAEFIAHAREDVPALIAEIERLHELRKDDFLMLCEARDDVRFMRKQVEGLCEALGFYANADNYEPVTIEKWLEGSYKMIKSIVPQSEYVVEDGGEIARQSLAGESDVQRKQDHHT